MNQKLLFFSRGRGHGHAIPDMLIADAVSQLRPDVSITFASYATGAATIRDAGRPVLDLDLPSNNSYLATFFACDAAIRSVSPTAVVAHEEFSAIAAARLHGVRSAFISAWLPASGSVFSESLAYADMLLIIENPGIFPVPPEIRRKPVYTGPIIRNPEHTVADRVALRESLGWLPGELCIAVVPGGGTTERESPIADIVLSAFTSLRRDPKRLVWVTSEDQTTLNQKIGVFANVSVVPFTKPIERILAAADVVITKGTRGLTLDCAAVGVPSISLSHGRNPIDDILVPRVHSNLALHANALDPQMLADYIESTVVNRGNFEALSFPRSSAANTVAEKISQLISEVESPLGAK